MNEDVRHDLRVVATLLDLETGEQFTDCRASTYDWTDGNWACDCNRGEGGGPCVSQRYIVVAVEPLLAGYTLKDFNSDYDESLLRKAGVL